LSLKFSKIDPLSFGDHGSLSADDDCYHLGEYTAHRGFSFSATNQLIVNLKKKPHLSSQSELRYKDQAINTVAAEFRRVLNAEPNRERLRASTLVPIPPSSIRGDVGYDDRMTEVLRRMGYGLALDIRELVKQHRTVPPAHECDERPTVVEILENYYIDETLADPAPRAVLIFDDVLTAGSHFKATQNIIRARFPGVTTAGLFVARRVPEAVDPESFLF
jgi:predicted amidophosphoribosyltransferase